MHNFIDYMNEVYANSPDIHVAEDNFFKAIEDDDNARELYREWCDEMGFSLKKGFRLHIIDQESDNIWDSMYPNREELDGYDF